MQLCGTGTGLALVLSRCPGRETCRAAFLGTRVEGVVDWRDASPIPLLESLGHKLEVAQDDGRMASLRLRGKPFEKLDLRESLRNCPEMPLSGVQAGRVGKY